jgi:hypothetical protein
VGAGLTASTVTSGAFSVTTFTAGTGTISFGLIVTINYLVIAGGGSGGGSDRGGGGGAGGYRTSIGTSGGGASAETTLSVIQGTDYTITVGAGGASAGNNVRGVNGNNSVFASVTSTAGGGGGHQNFSSSVGQTGGSGGGGGIQNGGGDRSAAGGSGTANQGYAGGNSRTDSTTYGNSGGGGGAGAVGATVSGSGSVGTGGNGVASSITGSSVTRAGGGGGGCDATGTAGVAGGSGGGGLGGYRSSVAATAGSANTGSGGGGAGYTGSSGAGGSGVVILSYPSTLDIRNGAGLTYTTSVVGSNKVTVFTAGTGNIQFADAVNSSFVLLETVTLTSAQASVEFTDLNTKYGSTYQHLQIRMAARCGAAANIKIQYNGDTAGNYSFHYLEGNGSSVISGGGTSASSGDLGVAVAESNVFSGFIVDILDAFETTKNKTGRSFYGAATAGSKWMGIMSHNWRSTSAVTSIKLAAGAQSFQSGSRIAIYGLKGS